MLPFSLAPVSELRVVSTGVGARGLPREGGAGEEAKGRVGRSRKM